MGQTMVKVQTPAGLALTRYMQMPDTWGVRYQGFHESDPLQQWIHDRSTKTIRTADAWCLSTSAVGVGVAGGRPIVLLTRCGEGDTLQQWEHDASNVLFNAHHGVCLDAEVTSGSIVQVWTCDRNYPAQNQQWLITPLLPGYMIQPAEGWYTNCLDLDNAKVEADSSVGLWTCNNDLPQHRWIYDTSDGGIKYAPDTRLCIDVPEGGERVTGPRVTTWWCDAANTNQRFDAIVYDGGAGYTLVQFQLRNTKWCMQPQGNAVTMTKCVLWGATQMFRLGTQLAYTLPGSPLTNCDNVQCKNDGVCANGSCQCKDGWTGGACETKADQLVGLETSDGFLLTVTGSTQRELTYEVPQGATTVQQQFLFNSLTKRLRVPDRWFCASGAGGAGSTATLALCDASASQQWVYDISKGTIQQSDANVCLESDARTVKVSACSPTTKPGQVWLVDENINGSGKLFRHRSALSSCMTVENGKLAIKPCDLKHRVWRHDVTYGEGQLQVGEQCLQYTARSSTKGVLAMGSCDRLADRNFEYDTATGLVRAFQTTLCVTLDAAAATVALATCDTKATTQHWFLPRRDQCNDPDFLKDMKYCSANEKQGMCAFNGCQCTPGYSGKRCEYETCSTTQCNNGGTCERGKCTCVDGYAGLFCDEFVKCKGVVCRNGGACNSKGTCTCPVGFSGDKCHVRHPKVLLRALGHRAIGVDGGRVVVLLPNVRAKDHVWWWDSAKKMLRSVGKPTYCLERSATGDAMLGACDEAKVLQQWQYDAKSGGLLTQDKRAAVRFEQLAADAGIRVVVAETATSTAVSSGNATLLNDSRVDIDRLDLPGTPLRNANGQCLSTTTSSVSFQDCNPDDDAQQWEYQAQNGLVRAALLDGSVCLALDGSAVVVRRCDGDDAGQAFRYDYTTKRFRNRKSLQCLAPTGSGLTVAACESAAPLHTVFRSFCDVVNLCGGGACAFERCVCPAGARGPFCAKSAV